MQIHETLYAVQVVFQSISSLAIAGGLVYTSFQFRNYRRAAHVANFSKLVELQMQLRKMRVENPDLAGVFQHDVQGMNTPQEIQYYFMNLIQLSLFEIAWFGHRHGQLPDDYFDSWVKRMDAIQREESFRKMWDSPSMKIMHDEFQKYMQDLMRKNGTRQA